MPIYTRRGDKGTTRLYGKQESISKTDPRINTLGAIDELNAQLGLALVQCTDRGVQDRIHRLQQDLFEIGAEIAAWEGVSPFKLRKSAITRLERWIDFYWEKLPPLSNFVFPGGTQTSAQLQVARTVARRAEREIVGLSQDQKLNPHIIAYLNRLSDFLLTLSRWANKLGGVGDVIWISTKKK